MPRSTATAIRGTTASGTRAPATMPAQSPMVTPNAASPARRGESGRWRSISIKLEPRLVGLDVLGGTARLRLLQQNRVLQHEAVHLRGHEAAVGILGRTDDWLPTDIEAGVHDVRTSGQLVEPLHQAMETSVALGVRGLRARGVVD